jgi:hypothetical protein
MSNLWMNMTGREISYRHQQLLDEAARNHLARIAGANNVTLYQRAALWLGRTLISFGIGLRRRCNQRREQAYLALTPFESRMEY